MPSPEWAACPRSDDSPIQIVLDDLPAPGDQLIDPSLADAERVLDAVDGLLVLQHLVDGQQARVLGGHLRLGGVNAHIEQDGAGGGVIGSRVEAGLHHGIPGDLLVFPILRLTAIRALGTAVPIIAADGAAALAAHNAAALADAVTVLGAKDVHHRVVDRLVAGRQLDGDRLSANVPGAKVRIVGVEVLQLFLNLDLDRCEINRLAGGHHGLDGDGLLHGEVVRVRGEVVVLKIDCLFLCHCFQAPFRKL